MVRFLTRWVITAAAVAAAAGVMDGIWFEGPTHGSAEWHHKLVPLLVAALADPAPATPAADVLIDAKAAAERLGITISYLRHHGDRLHGELLAATGQGFVVPWGDGTVRYSSAGLEALVAWRRSQPRTRSREIS